MLIGVISDTHGLLRREALAALQGVDMILHAGDVGSPTILHALERIATTHAVYGNVDPVHQLRPSLDLTLDGVRVHVSHGHEVGAPTQERLVKRYDSDIIIYGHTHKPLITTIGSTLIINPGAAGPRRFDLAPSIALLRLPAREAHIVRL